MPTRAEKFWIVFVFVAATIVRLYAAIEKPAIPQGDASDYHRLAGSLLAGRGLANENGTLTALRPPGYPFFLMMVYELAGYHYKAVYAVQALFGGIAAILIVFTCRLLAGPRQAVAAGVLAAFYPVFIWLSRALLSENLAVPLTVAILFSTIKLLRTRKPSWAVSLGVLLGVSILVRGATMILAGILLSEILIVGYRSRWFKTSIYLAALAGLMSTFLVAPWIVRNYRVFHRVVPVATQDGIMLYCSYWPPVRNGKRIWGTQPGEEDPIVAAADKKKNEVETSDYLKAVTIRRLRAQPEIFFREIPSKLVFMAVPLDWEIFPYSSGKVRSFNTAYCIAIILAVPGFLLVRKRQPEQWVLCGVLAALVIQSIVFFGSPRYRLPTEPVLLIYAGIGLIWIVDKLQRPAGLRNGSADMQLGS